MTFSQAISSFYSNYATFSGRSSRSAFWWVYLYTVIVTLICYIGLGASGVNLTTGQGEGGFGFWFWCGVLWLFGLVNIIPNLALTWRRMHDIGKGGGWIFISLVPVIGTIWFLVLCLTPSEPYPNRFGDPT